jgi:hypothetical protein
MDFQSLATLYRTKTDDELLQLAAQRTELIPDAQIALSAELAFRKVTFDQTVENTSPHDFVEIEPPPKVDRSPTQIRTGEFVHEVLRLYHRNLRIFVGLIFPAVLIGYGSVFLARSEAQAMFRHLNVGLGIREIGMAALKIQAVSLTGYCVSWIVFSASFAAICIATEQIQAGLVVNITGCLKVATDRVGSFLRLSLLLFGLYVLGIGVAELVSNGILWAVRFRLGHLGSLILISAYGAYAVAVIVLSRFGLAIPAFVLDDHKVSRAMFLSDELTEGKWPVLSVLLFKSIVGGYIAGMLPFWIARWIPASVNLPPWFPWILSGFSIANLTVVEPVMFIGFALLYLKISQVSHSEAARAVSA